MTARDLDIPDLAAVFGLSETKMRRRVYRFEKLLGGIGVAGKRVLEVGAGDGVFSCLLSLWGARSVISLEPEQEGHDAGALARFTANVRTLKLENVTPMATTLQAYDAPLGGFDLIISVASVNHLDEESCIGLPGSAAARKSYIELFRKFHDALTDGGLLIAADCGRANLFAWPARRLGIRNPLAPTVEWWKHQQPRVWGELLAAAGFSRCSWRWVFPSPLWLGADRLLSNAPLAYLSTSFFVLNAQRTGHMV
ncbi:MAG: class I SAM-dependent methyltransferase [Candidatus Eisenbacteria sp.]|nr:class I SAM-dependent methyltransferase [Candidatus Eisenbacteria bacterium]